MTHLRRYAYVARWMREQKTLVVAPQRRDAVELLVAQHPAGLWVVDAQARSELKPLLADNVNKSEVRLLTWAELMGPDTPRFDRVLWLDAVSALDDDALQWILGAMDPQGCFVYRHVYKPRAGEQPGAVGFWSTVNRLQCSFDVVELRAELELAATSVCPVQASGDRPAGLRVEDLLLRENLDCAAYWCFCAFESDAILGGQGATWVVQEPGKGDDSAVSGQVPESEGMTGGPVGGRSDRHLGRRRSALCDELTPTFLPAPEPRVERAELKDEEVQDDAVTGQALCPPQYGSRSRPQSDDSLCPSPLDFLEQVDAQNQGDASFEALSQELSTDLSITTARLATAQHRIREYRNAMEQAKQEWDQWHRVQAPEYEEQVEELERRANWLREDLRKSREEILFKDEELQVLKAELQHAQADAKAQFERAEGLRRLILSALDEEAELSLDEVNLAAAGGSGIRSSTSGSLGSTGLSGEPSSADLLRGLRDAAKPGPAPLPRFEPAKVRDSGVPQRSDGEDSGAESLEFSELADFPELSDSSGRSDRSGLSDRSAISGGIRMSRAPAANDGALAPDKERDTGGEARLHAERRSSSSSDPADLPVVDPVQWPQLPPRDGPPAAGGDRDFEEISRKLGPLVAPKSEAA